MLHSTISREMLDLLLNDLSFEYKVRGGNKRVDMMIVGGSSIIIDFNFRKSTIDIDALYSNNRIFKEAIAIVSKKYEMPDDWVNDACVYTPSYSPKLSLISKKYKTFNDILFVRYVTNEYLIAMKIKASRPTSNDIDDIIKMIYQLRVDGKLMKFDQIKAAFDYLYDSNYENVYGFFLTEAKKAFTVPIEEVKIILNHSIFEE